MRWCTTLVALALAGLLPAGCYYRLEGDFDPYRCDPACSDGKICHQGRCVVMDSGAADGPRADLNADGPLPDATQPDAPATDGGQPPDAPTPDSGQADGDLPDQGLPDGPTPDMATPDMATPDMAPPDTAPPDTGVVVPGTWVTIPPAGTPLPVTFSMGSPTTEPCREPSFAKETPHQVTLTRAFEITAHEVTQGEFLALMGYNPATYPACGTDCPVEYVTWHEAAAYCNALSAKAGLAACYACSGTGASVSCSEAAGYHGAKTYDCPGYRLPTEAEWEYAYRAGSTTAFYPSAGNNGTITNCMASDANATAIGWNFYNCAVSYAGCFDYSVAGGPSCAGTHPKAQKAPNAWGLYDIAGNVHEWCHDWYQTDLGSSAVTDPWGPASGSRRAWRGGSWASEPYSLRAAYRFSSFFPPDPQSDVRGFRPCRSKN